MEIIDQMVSAVSDSSRELRRKLYRLNRINGFRDKRVERMEAIQTILIYMFPMVELSTLSVGMFDDRGRFTAFCDYERIAKNTGLCLLRVKRAFKDLKAAGYIHVKRLNKQLKNGLYIGLTAVKTFTEIFFEHLNINSVWLKANREWKKGRDRLKFVPQEPTIKEQRAQHKIKKLTEDTLNSLTNLKREHADARREEDRRSKETNEYRDRQAYDKALEMHEKTKRPIKECFLEIKAAMSQPSAVHQVLSKKPSSSAVSVHSYGSQQLEKHLQEKQEQADLNKPINITNAVNHVALIGQADKIAKEQGREYAEVYDELLAGAIPT